MRIVGVGSNHMSLTTAQGHSFPSLSVSSRRKSFAFYHLKKHDGQSPDTWTADASHVVSCYHFLGHNYRFFN